MRRPALCAPALVFLFACTSKPAEVPSTPMTPGAPLGGQAAPYPQSTPYPQTTPAAQYPGGQYPASPTPQNSMPQNSTPEANPALGPNAPQATLSSAAVANLSLPGLRSSATQIIAELTQALPSNYQARVAGIPLMVDSTVGEINAFAACDERGHSAMAITDGLLQVTAVLAQAQAHDELLGTQKVDAYIQQCGTQLRPNQPVPMPAAGFFPGAQDPRVIQRAGQVFEEEVAFILGHELGHHYLGHLPCTAVPDALGAGEVGRVLSSAVPLFNQPNEIAADLAGTQNILNAGRARSARGLYAWSEGGGLLTMRFFAGFDQLTPEGVLLSFEHSHPLPQLRTPIIQQAAQNWRGGGGLGFPLLGL